ncbi:MAG: hypothetical protein J6Q52_05945 [Clostridia bacterium]|nr:hypothetical protein [Clostridia bacterium]
MFVKKGSKLVAILYFVIAILALIFAIECFEGYGKYLPSSSWEYTNYEYYGGDAYTGIQHACTDISDNVVLVGYHLRHMAHLLSDCIGHILIVASLVFVTLGIKSLKPVTYIEVKTDNIVNEENKQSEN